MKAVWFLKNFYHICLNFKGKKLTLTPLERDAPKKRKNNINKNYCRWLKWSLWPWRVICTGNAGMMGVLSWFWHPFNSNHVTRKATFDSSPDQALCTSSNIPADVTSLTADPCAGRGGQTTKTHAVHLECICCKSVHASLQLQRSHQIRQKLLRIDQTQNN